MKSELDKRCKLPPAVANQPTATMPVIMVGGQKIHSTERLYPHVLHGLKSPACVFEPGSHVAHA
eukprot:CAMPEP_0119102664 /NCGR_PEP_ID=MMETSP1180-20130426/1333_1 /TAXON_ID=3052 ORGANISM="Chlamydomonas cf sp, Strain CCMP681" /NCGR_SAMPLE_ID=MMETSP1180 /ASSEMBLY_ACC=CAM_ASM_000741 /LENGTH=63 /DNA_ID=CAMNT_0007086989 /DNA_START=168 /DNA_END=359 /DNA_ORIENTATION=+